MHLSNSVIPRVTEMSNESLQPNLMDRAVAEASHLYFLIFTKKMYLYGNNRNFCCGNFSPHLKMFAHIHPLSLSDFKYANFRLGVHNEYARLIRQSAVLWGIHVVICKI